MMQLNRNIGPFVEFVRLNSLSLLKNNDVVHSDESSLKSFFIMAIVLSLGTETRKYAESERNIIGTQVDAFITPPEKFPNAPIVHVEFKNTKIGYIDGWNTYDKRWESMNGKNEIVNKMSEEKLFQLKLKENFAEKDNPKTIKRNGRSLIQQTMNTVLIDENHIFCIYRIGFRFWFLFISFSHGDRY